MKPHAFIAMPFGSKPDASGQIIDFNRVYSEYIKPSLEAAGLEVFRADDIRTDILQELLLADLVVADLSIDTPVGYQLAVRHALRAPGGILIRCRRNGQPVDGYTDRTLCYHLKDGVPDPAFLDEDRRKLAATARETTARLRTLLRPRQVFLFSGHMIDAPNRPEPRFPAAQEAVAARAITNTLDTLDAGPEDLALCSGACGGDILFAEACLQRGVHLEMRLPFAIPIFLEKSVTFAGEGWRNRFYAIKDNPLTSTLIMPDELGPTTADENPYVRTNLWLLYTALAWGEEKVHFICLWNRQGGDGPGGTEHMHDEVNKRTGQVHVLDTNKLFTQP
jgi:hypothetical protein